MKNSMDTGYIMMGAMFVIMGLISWYIYVTNIYFPMYFGLEIILLFVVVGLIFISFGLVIRSSHYRGVEQK